MAPAQKEDAAVKKEEKKEDKKDADKKDTDKKKNKSKAERKKEQLNEEDQALKDEIALLVERCTEKVEVGLVQTALQKIAEKLRTASATMTSVPKPLKFLRAHYEAKKKFYQDERDGFLGGKDSEVRTLYADILSTYFFE